MAVGLKEHNIGTLVLVALIGILVGSYLSSLVCHLIPGTGNVVKTFFTYDFINFGVGDFANNKPVLVDLDALKFQIGFQIKFSLLSILGLFVSLYLFRWYK